MYPFNSNWSNLNTSQKDFKYLQLKRVKLLPIDVCIGVFCWRTDTYMGTIYNPNNTWESPFLEHSLYRIPAFFVLQINIKVK